ncbi:hypothetical protein Tco_0232536 [Tanacetum coccineum]
MSSATRTPPPRKAPSGVTYISISSDYEEPSDAGAKAGTAFTGLCTRTELYPVLSWSIIDTWRSHEVPPYATNASPTALALGYIADFDLEDEPEDGPIDYPADERDDDDDDSSGDDVDDEDEEEASEEDE